MTFNHTRGDSPLTPCAECARDMNVDLLLNAYLNAKETIEYLEEARAVGVSVKTADPPAQLADFIDHCKLKGLRGYKGEFVASDGTRIPCEFNFEREQRRSNDDGG